MIKSELDIRDWYTKRRITVNAQSNPITRGRLKTRHIVLLVHLDEQRSVLRAAKAANMTQPGASKLLTDLEDSLGVQLFKRHARGVEPTWYGEIMMRHARSALAEMDRAQEEIAAFKSGLTGQAAIGAVVSPGTNLVPSAVALLKRQHPRILVRIEIDNSPHLVDRLLKGELDIVVARVQGLHSGDELVFEALAGETHRVIAGAAHPLAGKRRLHLGDLVDQPWILPPSGSILRNRIDSMFIHRGLGLPRNLVETASIPVITSLLQSTDMVSALQEETVYPYCNAGLLTVLPLTLGVEMEPFGIITRRNHQMSPSAEAMMRALHDAAVRTYGKSSAVAAGGMRALATKPPSSMSTARGAAKRR
jgi:DNA-binding transcriptional LysR family regulator